MTALHGTCLDFAGFGVLLQGDSGSGKSDLALRLINRGQAVLVADDYVRIIKKQGRLYASPPETIAGRLEVRGAGIMRVDFAPRTRLELVIELVGASKVERLPDRSRTLTLAEGVELTKLDFYPFEVSAPDKLAMIVQTMRNDGWAEDIGE